MSFSLIWLLLEKGRQLFSDDMGNWKKCCQGKQLLHVTGSAGTPVKHPKKDEFPEGAKFLNGNPTRTL